MRKGDFDVKIGYRTIKTALGAPIAIWIAQLLGMTNIVSAGILTILSIQPSKKKSMISAWHRFSACMIGMLFAYVFFEFLGYNPFIIGLLLIIFIPVTVYLKITQGIITSSVIILNLYSAGTVNLSFVGNQIVIILIGIGTALLLNLYMPSLDHKLQALQLNLEKNIQKILFEISMFIRDKQTVWHGKELIEVEDILTEASNLVVLDKENHLLRSEHTYYEYFTMRTKQFELLRKMIPLVSKIENIDFFSEKTANFFEDLSEAVQPGNTAIIFLDKLEELRAIIREKELPTTREEFETRANLFRLLHEIEDYLIIKDKFNVSNRKNEHIKKKTGNV